MILFSREVTEIQFFSFKKKLLNMVSFSGDGECDVLILFCSLDTYMSRGVLCFGEFCFASDYGMCFVCERGGSWKRFSEKHFLWF